MKIRDQSCHERIINLKQAFYCTWKCFDNDVIFGRMSFIMATVAQKRNVLIALRRPWARASSFSVASRSRVVIIARNDRFTAVTAAWWLSHLTSLASTRAITGSFRMR